MDSAETFYSSFKFDGNTEFLDGLMKRLDGLETKLAQGVSKSMGRALDSMDAFAASCLDAGTDAGKLFAKLDRADQIAKEMDDLAESAKAVPKSLEQIAHEAKVASDRFDALNGSADPALRGIVTDAEKAAHKMETLDDKTARLGDSWGKMRNMGITVGAALTAAGYGMWYALDKSTEMMDGLDESAQAAGTSATALAQLQYAATKGGSSAEELGVSLKTLSVNAAAGDKAFEAMGVNVRDSSGQLKKSDALFLEVGNKLQGMSDRTQAAAIATTLFGRSGSKMLSVFGTAPGTIEATMKEAEKLGLVFSEADLKSASDFQDSIMRVGVAFQLASAKLLTGIGPKVTQFMENLTAKLAAFSDSEAGKKLAEGMGKFADAAMRAFDVLTDIAPKLLTIGLQISNILIPLTELVAKFLEIPGAAEAVGVAIAAAFGGIAVSRMLTFGSDLMGVARGFESISAGTVGLAGKVESVRGALNGLNTAAKANLVLLAAWTTFEAYKAFEEGIQKRKDEKNLKEKEKASSGYAHRMSVFANELNQAKETGDMEAQNAIRLKMARTRDVNAGGHSYENAYKASQNVSKDAKGGVRITNNDNRISQTNTIGADISKIGDLIGKNLEKLVRSQINIDVVSSRVVRMGGV